MVRRVVTVVAEDLERAIRAYVAERLPNGDSPELAEESWHGLLHLYAASRARYVPARPRRAHASAELLANPKLQEYRKGYDAVVRKIESGDDLTPHLSTAVSEAYLDGGSAREMHRRRDGDLLLADWGIHHLHLSDELRLNGFVRRTSDVLFAIFRPDDAYLVDIFAHPAEANWAARRILEIVVRTWPDAELVWGGTFATGLTRSGRTNSAWRCATPASAAPSSSTARCI